MELLLRWSGRRGPERDREREQAKHSRCGSSFGCLKASVACGSAAAAASDLIQWTPVAGSHNRNELVVIRRECDEDSAPKGLKGQICQICGDDVGLNADGELFVACNECAFPVCRTCYEYERREGSQVCPQCKTRFKRLKG